MENLIFTDHNFSSKMIELLKLKSRFNINFCHKFELSINNQMNTTCFIIKIKYNLTFSPMFFLKNEIFQSLFRHLFHE